MGATAAAAAITTRALDARCSAAAPLCYTSNVCDTRSRTAARDELVSKDRRLQRRRQLPHRQQPANEQTSKPAAVSSTRRSIVQRSSIGLPLADQSFRLAFKFQKCCGANRMYQTTTEPDHITHTLKHTLSHACGTSTTINNGNSNTAAEQPPRNDQLCNSNHRYEPHRKDIRVRINQPNRCANVTCLSPIHMSPVRDSPVHCVWVCVSVVCVRVCAVIVFKRIPIDDR